MEAARLLLADDEEAIRETYSEILRAAGHEVDVAADGDEVLEKVRNHPYDLLLTDLVARSGFTGIRGRGAPILTEGWRLDVVSEIRVNRGIVVTGVFGIDQPKGFARVTEGRMEIRGTF